MRRTLITTQLLVTTLVLTINFPAFANIQIASITDGDTIKLSDMRYVRLLQIDTPELLEGECYAKRSQKTLARLLSKNGVLRLVTDHNLDQVDQYGRLLRYIFKGKTNINLEMVRLGAATPYFYRGDRGKYAKELMSAAQTAKARSIGLWRKCPGTELDPKRALNTRAKPNPSGRYECDPNYDRCLPLFPPDLNCSDIRRLGQAPVRVIGKDVHRLDADGDGIACTS